MKFTGIIMFGDSLSDIGNTKDLLKVLNKENAPSFSPAYLQNPSLQLHPQSQYIIYPAEYQYPDNSLSHKAQYGVYNTMLRWMADALVGITDTSNAIPLVPRDFYDELNTGGQRFSNGEVWVERFARRSGILKENEFTFAKTIEYIQSDANRPGFPFYTNIGDRLVNRAFGGAWVAPNKRQQWKRNNAVIDLDTLINQGTNLSASKTLYGWASKSNFSAADAVTATAQLATDPTVTKSITYLQNRASGPRIDSALESKDVQLSSLSDYYALFQDLVNNKVLFRLIPPNINLVVQSYIREKDHYIPDMNKKIDDKPLYVVYGGGNDYLNMLYIDVPLQSVGANIKEYTPNTGRYRYPDFCTGFSIQNNRDPNVMLMKSYVDNVIYYLKDTVQRLHNAGAKNFLMASHPFFSDAPEYTHFTPPAYANDVNFDRSVFRKGLDCAIDYHNYRLRELVTSLNNMVDSNGNAAYQIGFFNVNRLIQDAIAKNITTTATSYNIPSYIENSCTQMNSTAVGTDGQAYLYSYENQALDTGLTTQDVSQIKSSSCSCNDAPDCKIGCVNDKKCVADHVFWDNVHPTKRIHKYIGDSLCEHNNNIVEFYYPSSSSLNNTCP